MGHSMDAHKRRARAITNRNTSSACGTITVVEQDDGSEQEPAPGDGSDDQPDSGGFLQENATLIAGAAAVIGVGAALGRR